MYMREREIVIEKLFVTGVNFHKSEIKFRSKFSLNKFLQNKFLQLASERGFKVIVLLNTCNRCEMYGVGDMKIAEKLLCEITNQSIESYSQNKFVKYSDEALNHIFNVAAGIDSQILGDNEVLGQFKFACKLSKQYNLLGSFFERIANTAIQSAKEIRKKTDFSKGTTSVSYAAINLIKSNISTNKVRKVLVVGAGKFGNAVVKNIISYLPKMEVTISNRTEEVAKELSQNLNLNYIPFSAIESESDSYDIIITCTNADNYIIKSSFIGNTTEKILLDLSVPSAIDPMLKNQTSIKFYDVDDISIILNKTIGKRKEFLPIAKSIISKNILEFNEWYSIYLHNKKIKITKNILEQISNQNQFHVDNTKIINKALNTMVSNIKAGNQSACHVLSTVNTFLDLNTNLNEAHH